MTAAHRAAAAPYQPGPGLDPNDPNPNRRPGRPRSISSPAELVDLAERYVAECLACDPPAPILWTGLALYLGMSGRQALNEYGSTYPEYSTAIKQARSLIEQDYEAALRSADTGGAAAGAIFGLKNMGWSDRVDVSGVIAHLDIGRLGDEQVERLARGEHVLAVLNGAPKRAQLGKGDPPPGEPAELVTSQDAPGTPSAADPEPATHLPEPTETRGAQRGA
jgi:hypothetical protein